jgi:hypothetical protein
VSIRVRTSECGDDDRRMRWRWKEKRETRGVKNLKCRTNLGTQCPRNRQKKQKSQFEAAEKRLIGSEESGKRRVTNLPCITRWTKRCFPFGIARVDPLEQGTDACLSLPNLDHPKGMHIPGQSESAKSVDERYAESLQVQTLHSRWALRTSDGTGFSDQSSFSSLLAVQGFPTSETSVSPWK